MEFLQWLQSSEGGLAGGATNSWEGQYGTPPSGTPTFYGMFYDQQPVWHDPPSNQWFGFQTWGMERIAEYYQATGDARAKKILDKWVPWAIANTTVGAGGSFQIPADLTWSGAPDTWNATSPGSNTGLHVTVKNYSQRRRGRGLAGQDAALLRVGVEQRPGEDGRGAAADRAVGEHGHQGHRGAGDPDGLQPVRRRLQRHHGPGAVRAHGLDGHDAERRRDQLELHVRCRSGRSTRATRSGRRSSPTWTAAPRRRSPTTGSGRSRRSPRRSPRTSPCSAERHSMKRLLSLAVAALVGGAVLTASPATAAPQLPRPPPAPAPATGTRPAPSSSTRPARRSG